MRQWTLNTCIFLSFFLGESTKHDIMRARIEVSLNFVFSLILNLYPLRIQPDDFFYFFSTENKLWHFMQIKKTIYMKCRSLFSGKK